MKTVKRKQTIKRKATGILRSSIAMALIVLSANSALKAQDRVQPTWWFGAAGGANFNFYRGTVQILNANLSTDYAFDKGFGVAPYAAIFAEYRANRVLGLMLNVAYDGRRGTFSRSNGSSSDLATSLNAEFDYIAFEPSLRIAPFAGNFYIFLGPRLSLNIDNHFQYQAQYQPNNEATWSDVYGVRIGAQIGMGYDIAISKPDSRTQFDISPFVAFLPYFGEQPRSIENLTLTTVRAGIAFKIGCGPKPVVKTAEVAPTPVPAEPVVDFSVQAPNAIPGQRIVKETLPLCNYVFFDAGSTEIPNRYVILTKDQATGFKEEQLQDCQKNPGTRATRQMAMYHNVMNIVADRMRRYPESTIKLVGASAGKGSVIGKANAVAVKDYLVNVFGINESRITVEGLNRPMIASEQAANIRDTNLTRVEDNRVDIVSTSHDLMMEIKDNTALCLKPVEVTATDGSSMNDAQVFVNADGASNGLQSWSVDVTDPDGTVQHFGPYTTDKQTISGSAILRDNKNGEYKIVMTGYTKTGHAMTKESTFSLIRKAGPDQQEHRLSILFEFDKSKTVATFDKFLNNNVAPLIVPNSVVTISGYTDVVGTTEHNQTLSTERAQEAQLILEGATAKAGITGVTYQTNGYGENGTTFANTLPEERFYNRTVMIDISPSETIVSK